MTEKLSTVRLGGRLGREYGREFRLAVGSPAEAVAALCAVVPGFKQELATSGARGVDYRVRIDDEEISEHDLHFPAVGKVIRINPVIRGSKNGGLFQVILGAALIAASFYTGGLATAGYMLPATAANLGTAVFAFGFSMALGGVVQMLSPQQRGLSTRDNPENGASYNFNGPVNTTRQGACVPLGYGEMFVGSATISAGIYAANQA